MTKLVVALGFCVAFAAGLAVGLQQGRRSAVSSVNPQPPTTMRAAPGRGRGQSFLVQQLNLTPQQQQELQKIWSDMAGPARGDQEDRRRQLRNEREDAVAALVRPEDYGKLDQILRNSREQFTALDAETKAKFDAAVEKTKAILTPEQRTKYEDLLNRHQFPGPRGGPGGPGGPDHEHGDRGPGRGPGADWARDHELNRDTTRRSDAGAASRPVNP